MLIVVIISRKDLTKVRLLIFQYKRKIKQFSRYIFHTMSTFHENTKFLITKELFISVNVVNGKYILTLYNARRIPSTIHPQRTISVPCSPGIALDYEQYIQLMEKVQLF